MILLLLIDENYRVNISSEIISKDYLKYDGIKINLPNNIKDYPSKEALSLKKEEFRE